MYGWRAKLGFIVPANNTVIEPELYSVVPDGVSLHFTKLDLRRTEYEQVDKAMAVKLLGCGRMDVISYACMSGSLLDSANWESETFAKTEIRAVAATTALMEGVRTLKAKKIAIVTHYAGARLTQVRHWFEQNDLSVVSAETLELLDQSAVCDVPIEAVYRLAKTVNRENADCLCLLATDLRTFPIIHELEKDIGKPVVSSNQTLLWKALRIVGIDESIKSCGQLFEY
jgi:maleate isomerase